MNQLMLVVVAVVALCYCGGNYCPKVLSSNKEMLLGVAVGMALCSFMDLRMEGFSPDDYPECCRDYADMSDEDRAFCVGELTRMDGFVQTDMTAYCNKKNP
jgi:hypothetical protein